MNIGKLKRVAIKEFKRSPAKAGILLAMLPVALYFCLPLCVGALKKHSTSAAAVAPDSKNADFLLPAATEKVTTPSRVRQGWVEVARWLENDLLAVPVSIPMDARNPFAALGQEKNDESLTEVEDGQRVVRPETQNS